MCILYPYIHLNSQMYQKYSSSLVVLCLFFFVFEITADKSECKTQFVSDGLNLV